MRQVVVYLCILVAFSCFVDETTAGGGRRRRRKSAELSKKLETMSNLPAKVNALYSSKIKHDAHIKTTGVMLKQNAPTSFQAQLLGGHTGTLAKHSAHTSALKVSPLATVLPGKGFSTINTVAVNPRSSLINTASIPTTPILPQSASMKTASTPTTPILPRSASMKTASIPMLPRNVPMHTGSAPHPTGTKRVASVSTAFVKK
jgi:hypothetical protein